MEWSEKALYRIQDKLDRVLEMEFYMFPQYTRKPVGYAEFQKFYYKLPDEKKDTLQEWGVRKILNKIITKKVVQEYKELALTGIWGIGMAETKQQWHEELADWLENIIRSNDNIVAYVEGKFKNEDASEKPQFTESEFIINAVQAKLEGVESLNLQCSLYPEEFLPYLAQVQLLIQKICCKHIKDDMIPRVIQIYRKAFLEDEPKEYNSSTMVSQK